ncbi:hypothetical protein BGZ46_008399 [Entomortierella lignicola]|nr:hypothetical protein BGZ46_008399 [Entomortierella lignicola]
MGWDQLPPLDKVLANLLSIIEQARNGDSEPNGTTFIEIYRYLMKHINNHEALSAMKGVLDSQPWILVNGTLHPTDRVALNISFDLVPHFVQIRSPGLEKLFLAMGVRQEVVQKDLEGIISKVASRYGDEESLSDTDAELVLKVLKFIAIGDTYFSDKLQVLTQDNRLRLVNEVVYDDLSQRRDPLSEDYDEDSYTFASNRIRHAVAETLGIPMFSARYLSDQRDTTFEPWAQEENIGTRIKNLLNDYDPSSLFSEFLQNAADAGATKISFMLDQRTFGKNNLFSDEMAAWQGPALVIYNDAEFSESDFKALTDLGVGNKRGDSSKIGRNGVGFNSVYHITDVPSVVSGSYVGFFDPMRDNLPKGRSSVGAIRFGGLRYNFLNFRRGDAFSEQLDPYKGLFGCDMKSHFQGTIFRIPLRVLDTDSNKTPRKHVIDKQWTPLDVRDMLMKWVGEAKVGMLFLDSIRATTFAIESAQGNDFLCSFEKSFVNEKSLLIDALQKGNDTSNATNVIDISTSNSKAKKESQRWLVHTDHGYPENTSQDIRNIAAGNRWRPHSGIAFLIGNSPEKEGNSSEKDGNSSKKGRFFGRLFVHLPTPIITQLPFHIHGGFALTSDRKNFAGETDATDSHKWNEFMMRDRLPQTALAAMEKLLILKFHGLEKSRSHQIDLIGATETYFEFWPIKAQSRFNLFAQMLLHMSYNRQVYPVRVLKQDSTDVNVRFLSGREVEFPELTGASTKIKDTICDYLRKKGVNICDCPQDIQTRLRNEWREITFPAINEDRIRRIICEDPAFIPSNFSKNIQRNSTGLSELRWILEYVLKVILDPRANPRIPVADLCLLPLMNNAWIPLAPLCGRYTINSRVRNLIRGEEYLVDQSVFESTPETSQIGLIFERLCSIYGITQLPPNLFVSIFNSENPGGVTEQQRGELWGLLRDTQSFDAYGELPILMTSTGRNVQLKFYRQGIDISQFDFQRRIRLQTISALATELGLVIFDATQNYQNSYLISVARAVTDSKILSHISRECARLPASRLISREEAEVLQQMIKADITLNINELAQLGLLRIWPSWDLTNAQSPPLIPARGSYFIHGSYTLEHFGGDTTVIRSATNHRFKEMGAISLDPLRAAEKLVIPRFLDGALSFNNYQTKTAYINLLWEIIGMQRIYYSNGHITNPATTFLSQNTVLLGRDGILHHSQELLNPDDDLLTLIFDGEPSKFPDNQLWQTLRNSPERSLLKIPSMGDTNVIRECALHVLSLIDLNVATSQSATRTKASRLILHIYDNYCNIDWMSPEWRIVPAKVARDPPCDECVPDFPKYMSFSELIDPSFHEVCWTQHAFFPKNLAPSENFKANYPSVGKPKTEAVIKHLSVLASLTPKWTSFERKEYLKKCAIAVYKFLNEVLKRGPAEVELLKRELKAMKDPFILNGDKWLWPAQILLDVDNGTDRHRVVHDDLLVVREFLLIAGVGEMKTVDNIVVEIPEGRSKGYIEDQLFHSFEHQDQRGFMDVLFRFENGKEIRAHKVILIHANEHFKSMFEGPWAEFIERDSTNLDIQIIDLSNIQNKDQNETYEAFWGLIHYFYRDVIISTNGPPALSTVPRTAADEDVGPLVARVQFLIELLCLSNLYQAPRLKKLIASEIIRGGKTIHGNVFSVNKYAALYESSELKEYCEKFVRKNATSIRASINHEIQDLIKKMAGLGDSDKVMREKLIEEIKELGDNLGELDILNA